MKKLPTLLLLILLSTVAISAFNVMDTGSVASRGRGDLLFNKHHNNMRADDLYFDVLFAPRRNTSSQRAILGEIIDKSDMMSYRLKSSIYALKAEGEDVEDIELMLNEYTALINEARAVLNMSMPSSKVRTSGYDGIVADQLSAEESLARSRSLVIQANSRLKAIFSELRPYISSHVAIDESAGFVAQGCGVVVLSGRLNVDALLSNGNVSFMDLDDNASISVGNCSNPEITVMDTGRKVISYSNVSHLNISGSRLVIGLSGDRFSLVAHGSGMAELFGDGTFYFDNGVIPIEQHMWKKSPFVSEPPHRGEPAP